MNKEAIELLWIHCNAWLAEGLMPWRRQLAQYEFDTPAPKCFCPEGAICHLSCLGHWKAHENRKWSYVLDKKPLDGAMPQKVREWIAGEDLYLYVEWDAIMDPIRLDARFVVLSRDCAKLRVNIQAIHHVNDNSLWTWDDWSKACYNTLHPKDKGTQPVQRDIGV